MANDNEPAKLLLPYLQRADELQKHDPLVAYYCRLYAMERGLKFPQSERTKTTNNLLVSLMKQLEKDKKSLKLGPDDQLHLEGFALNVFEKADKQDRAGRANLGTAKTFYAASIFFEILNQFGELQADLEQKQKYAAWKAADIRKAIKEGRAPIPGPPGGEENFSVPSSTSSGEYDVEPSRPDPAFKSAPPQFYDEVNRNPTADIPPSHSYDEVKRQHLPDIPPSHSYNEINRHHSSEIPPSHSYDEVSRQYTSDIPPPESNNSPTAPPHLYPSSSYPSHDIHPSQNIKSEDTSYPQPYHRQPYSQEPHHQFPQDYPSYQAPSHEAPSYEAPSHESPLHKAPSHEAPSHSLPNFQSYPSFTETNLPMAPSHYPSYFQGSDSSYPNPDSAEYTPAPSKSNQHIYAQGTFSPRIGNTYDNIPAPVQTYQYDSNYQPAPEKIADAHKAARFAVGALAFDDVPTAVDFLKKSLELLTNPAAGH